MEHPTKLSAWRHPRAAGKGQTGVEGLVPGQVITRMSLGGSSGDSDGKGLKGFKVHLVHCTTCNSFSQDQLLEAMADDLSMAAGPVYISFACRQHTCLLSRCFTFGEASRPRNTWLVSKEGAWCTRKRGQGVIGRIHIPNTQPHTPSLLAVEDEVLFLRNPQ